MLSVQTIYANSVMHYNLGIRVRYRGSYMSAHIYFKDFMKSGKMSGLSSVFATSLINLMVHEHK